MSKKEKYYNYIINDLVKDTNIDEELSNQLGTDFVVFPFKKEGKVFGDTHMAPVYSLGLSFMSMTFKDNFTEHLQSMYGVREDEVEILNDLYANALKEKFNV
tara:strand:- start:63 stop:368 length:306 start_codon:yes stop_codon:yes gene_type:complete